MDGKYLEYIRQNRKKIGVSIVVLIFLIALGIAILPDKYLRHSTMQSNKTVYVAGDGSGDFNCDGSDDHIEINKALEYVAENPQYTTVHLKGPGTYVISDSIFIGSNTVLEGDSTAVIKLANHAGWPAMRPLIQQMNSLKNDNITVKGFEVNGNYAGNSEIKLGRGYYNIMYFNNCKNVKVSKMYMHDGMGDGLRVENGSGIQFYNNKIYKLGHDGLYAINCSKVEAWNNRITCRTNSALRASNSNRVKFHDNVIDSFNNWNAGGPGVQVEKSKGIVNDIEVYNNTINDTYGPGIWLVGYGEPYSKKETQNVHIHHNVLYNTGTNPSIDWVGGIVTSGFYDTLIENNVFDGVYHAAVTHMYPPVSTGVDSGIDLSPQGKGYTTIVRNNIIVNTRERSKDPSGTGYGIINYLPETHTFILENNCLYNNFGGNYKNANSTSDIYVDPLFVNQQNHNYHLKSTSPCIGAGYLSPDSSIELGSSDKHVNIGRYS
jgi:Disaggregatase related/Pectate lyase superfamily protein